MDIKILDSWLRDYLETEAKPDEIARALSLTSASIEKIEPFDGDFIYHVEVTTNRPDMASVVGLAREASAVLPRFEIPAKFIRENQSVIRENQKNTKENITIINDPKLVRRICAVILEVQIGESPEFINKRLEASGTRSLNNLIDITNYVMHEIGHPTHAFDYDRLTTKKLIIRESKKGEKIATLDKKQHVLQGGDIVADNGKGEIVDLLGVMGTENSVVTNSTKRILFFIDNNDPKRIRKTSMSLAIRTEAAGLNEKDVDPELAMPALLLGIELYQKYAKAKIISDIIDIYPHKPKTKVITVSVEKINKIVGIDIPVEQSVDILMALGFQVKTLKKHVIARSEERTTKQSRKDQENVSSEYSEIASPFDKLMVRSDVDRFLEVTIPSWRNKDIAIEEDIIEEVARVFGYHNIPSKLPSFDIAIPYHIESNPFFWEERAKDAMKYWEFTETYTYSMVSKKLFGKHVSDAVSLENPLDAEHVYLRQSLVPSLLEVINENRGKDEIKIFEIANVYSKRENDLPDETRNIATVYKGTNANFYSMKGIVEQLTKDMGIQDLGFEDLEEGIGAQITHVIASYEIAKQTRKDQGNVGSENNGIASSLEAPRNDIQKYKTEEKKEHLGKIEVLSNNLVAFELNFDLLISHATLKKSFTPIAKFPPVIEDLALIVNPEIKTGKIIKEITSQSPLIIAVSLLDQFENTRTFHIVYQDRNKNLISEEVTKIREKILKSVSHKFAARLKE